MRHSAIAALAGIIVLLGGLAWYFVFNADAVDSLVQDAPTQAMGQPLDSDKKAQKTVTSNQSTPKKTAPIEVIFGSPNAPVEIIEYMSLTCGHCARFHKETMPTVMETYVKTGKIRMIVRDFPLDGIAYRTAMISHCLAENKPMRYYGFLQYLFEQQGVWARSPEPLTELARMAQIAGLSKDNFDLCLTNEELSKKVLLSRQFAESEYGVNSTPTFIINGKVFSGVITLDEFEKAITTFLPN